MSYDKCATDLKVKWKKYAADNQCEYFGNQHVDKEVMEVKLHATQSSLKECHIELASCISSRLSNTSFASESQTLLNDVSLISLKDKESSFQLIQKERADLISKLNKLSISLQQEYGYITNEMNARMAALQLESFSPL
uniref:Uncharacterized protein n=1 Tax=Proboscia inermis TaxID=420281 RepID=A0A7S0CK89_9STRA